MDRLSEGLRAALSRPMADELETVLGDMAEEARNKEQAMKATLEKLLQDLTELEEASKVEKEEWEREKERLEAAVEGARREEQEHIREMFKRMEDEVNSLAAERDEKRQENVVQENEVQRMLILLEQEEAVETTPKDPEQIQRDTENWIRRSNERDSSALSTVLCTAALKQIVLKELKSQAGRQMVEIEPLGDQNQMLQGGTDFDLEKKMGHLMAVSTKEEEKIRAAELKELRKLEEKTREALVKIHKAELKEKKRKEAKEKKKAEKLERTRAKEEESETRQSRCCSWRKFFCFC